MQEYTTEFKKMAIMLGISPKNLDVLLKYLGGLHHHLCEKGIFFKAQIGGRGLCTGAVPGENRHEESILKWIEVGGATRSF